MAKKDDKLFQIIAEDSKVAAKALDRLTDSIQTLDAVSSSLRDLDKLSSGLEAIRDGLKLMTDLPKISGRLESVRFGNFGKQITLLAEALDPLRGFTTQATGLINALSKVSEGVDTVKGTSFGGFHKQMEKLASGLEQLNVIDTKVGATIESLAKIKQIVDDVNKLNVSVKGRSGFDHFKDSILSLTQAFLPLNDIKSTLGSVLRELRRFVATSNSLRGVDMKEFTGSLLGIQRALSSLSNLTVGDFDIIAKSLRVLVKAFVLAGEPLAQKGIKTFTSGTFEQVIRILGELSLLQNNDFSLLARGVKILVEAIKELGSMKDTKIEQFTSSLGTVMQSLISSLSGLAGLDMKGFATLVRNLDKIPAAIIKFNDIDQASFDEFIKKVGILADSLAPLEQRLAVSVQGLKQMPAVLNKAINASTKASGSFFRLGSSLFSLRTILGGAGLVYFINRLSMTIRKAIKISNDFVETLNLFAVSLGQNAAAGYEIVKSWKDIIGLDPAASMAAWGEFNLLLQGFGPATEAWLDASYKMSRNLTQLAYDLSSLYNVDPSIAITKLNSAMAGMTRPLREWGIDVSTASLQAFALSRGITKSVISMTQAEKAQLRYLLIMQKTSDAVLNVQGDLARTLVTPGNALRILRQQFTNLFRAIGDFIAPMVSIVLPYVAAFTKGLIGVFERLALFMQELTGYRPFSLEDALDGAGEGGEDAADGIDEATDSVEDFDNAVSSLIGGLDKFTTLSKGSGGISEMFLTDADLEAYDFAPIANAVDELIAKFKPFFDFVESVLKGLSTFVYNLNITFDDLVDLIRVLIAFNLAKWFVTSGTAMVQATTALNGFFKAMSENGSIFANWTKNTTIQIAAIGVLIFAIMKILEYIKWFNENVDSMTRGQKALHLILIVVSIALTSLYTIFVVFRLEIVKTAAVLIGKLIWAGLMVLAQVLYAVLVPLTTLIVKLVLLTIKFWMLSLAIAAVLVYVWIFTSAWQHMTGWEKAIVVLGALAAAAFFAAKAFGVMHAAWSIGLAAVAIVAGIAAITAAIGAAQRGAKVQQFAEGGFPTKGSLFIANERGPELVGAIGRGGMRSNAVANNDMITEAIRQASYLGMVEAIKETNGGNGGQKLVLDGANLNNNALARALFPALKLEAKRNGGDF